MSKALGGQLKLANSSRNIWTYTPPASASLKDLQDPSYWANVTGKLRPLDRIEIVPEDMSYFAELIVLASGRNYAKVKLLQKFDIDEKEVEADKDEYRIHFVPSRQFRVTRIRDNKIMQENLQTKEDAATWLAMHRKEVA